MTLDGHMAGWTDEGVSQYLRFFFEKCWDKNVCCCWDWHFKGNTVQTGSLHNEVELMRHIFSYFTQKMVSYDACNASNGPLCTFLHSSRVTIKFFLLITKTYLYNFDPLKPLP